MRLISIFYLCMLTSCVGFHYTEINEPNSIRPNNPNVFKYKKPSLSKLDKSLIDLNSIYLVDSQYNKFDYRLFNKRNSKFIRFFSGGQILLVYCDTLPPIERINNKHIGTPGYFYIKSDEIRIEFLDETNGGQLSFQLGKILNNGDIMLYETSNRFPNKSINKLEKQGKKTFWKKTKIPDINNYIPDW